MDAKQAPQDTRDEETDCHPEFVILGRLLKQARKARGWSQDRLAAEVGVTRPTIDALEKGRGTLELLRNVGEALGVRAWDLWHRAWQENLGLVAA